MSADESLDAMLDRILAIFMEIWGDWQTERSEEAFAPFSHAGRVFSMISFLDKEVSNGGFHQWIGNPTGMYVRETHEALLEIGANEVAAMVERAMKLFPGKCPARDYHDRDQQLRELSKEADEILYAMDRPYEKELHNLYVALLRYWEEHGDQPKEADDSIGDANE